MPDLDRIRYLTANYRSLQGLKRVPLGLWFLIAGAVHIWWPAGRRYVDPTTTGQAIGVGVALLLGWGIARAYRARYGSATGEKPPASDREWTLGAAWFVAVFAALLYDARHQQHLVYVSYLLFAAPAFYWGWADRYRRHYLVAGLLIAALAFDPLFTGVRLVRWGMDEMAIGIAAIVTGIADHVVWVRALRGLKVGDHGEPV